MEGRREGGREGGRKTHEGNAVDTLVLHALMDDTRVPGALVFVLAVDEDLGREGGREGDVSGGGQTTHKKENGK